MNAFINAPQLDAMVKGIVRRTFPAASPSSVALSASDSGFRSSVGVLTDQITGSKKTRFVWGTSRIGGANLVG